MPFLPFLVQKLELTCRQVRINRRFARTLVHNCLNVADNIQAQLAANRSLRRKLVFFVEGSLFVVMMNVGSNLLFVFVCARAPFLSLFFWMTNEWLLNVAR